MVFLASKTLLYPLSTWIFMNLMILQMLWDECVRFGGHISIQASYKILQLKAQMKSSILHNVPCFQEGVVLK
jgi:hypothetical protein